MEFQYRNIHPDALDSGPQRAFQQRQARQKVCAVFSAQTGNAPVLPVSCAERSTAEATIWVLSMEATAIMGLERKPCSIHEQLFEYRTKMTSFRCGRHRVCQGLSLAWKFTSSTVRRTTLRASNCMRMPDASLCNLHTTQTLALSTVDSMYGSMYMV